MIVHRAAWVLPVSSPPIANGWIALDRDRIVAVGGPAETPPPDSRELPDRDAAVGPRAILPGLVNAHVHLELSWMRGAVRPASTMPAWASTLMALRRSATRDPDGPIRAAIREARACGTVLVGDVTNTLASVEPLASSSLAAAMFYEQLGFAAEDPERVVADAHAQLQALGGKTRLRCSVVPHAPYSVSPGLLRAIAARAASDVVTIHLGESAEELQFLQDGSGAWRALLEQLGVWNDSWVPPQCGPVEYIARAGFLHDRLVAVHGVQLTDGELERLAAAGATLVSCPRSNVWTGAGVPPVDRFYRSGVRVALGTDSLASVDDLNVFSELAAVRTAAAGVPASRLIESATRAGADALGFGAELGTLEADKQAELLSVRLPADVADVEEYLVSGIGPERLSWLTRE